MNLNQIRSANVVMRRFYCIKIAGLTIMLTLEHLHRDPKNSIGIVNDYPLKKQITIFWMR